MPFSIFPLHLSKVLRLPRKSDAKSCDVLHPSRKIILANLKIWCSKMQPLSGNQRPDLLTSLMSMSLVLRPPRDMHLCRSSWNVPRLPSFLEMLQNPPHVLLTFDKVHNPLPLPHKTTSERPKVLRTHQFLILLTWNWKCASHHNGVHFFDMSTFKSNPTLRCFVHFDIEITFAPQRRAFFPHGNFQLPQVVQEWCVLCILTLQCASRHNGVHFFDISTLKKVLWKWCALCILTSQCASRQNGVQFFISHLARWLRTRCFSEPTFRPSGATNHWKKHSESRLFYLFAHLHLSSDSFSSLIVSLLLFSSLLWLFPPLLFHL